MAQTPVPKAKRTASLIYKAVLTVIALTGMALNLQLFTGHPDFNTLNYFTMLSNVMVDVYLVAFFLHLLIKKGEYNPNKRPFWPGFKYATQMAIVVTMLVATFLLGGGVWFDDAGNFVWATPILHYIVPIGFVLDWLLFDKKGSMHFGDVLLGLLMPILYLTYVMIRVNVFNSSFNLIAGSRYPYDFLDLDKLPFETVATTVAFMAAFFVVLGLIFLLIDKILKKIRQKRKQKQAEQQVTIHRAEAQSQASNSQAQPAAQPAAAAPTTPAPAPQESSEQPNGQ